MANIDERDFDEKRLARRQQRKKSEFLAYMTLVIIILAIIGGIVAGVIFIRGMFKNRNAENVETEEMSEETQAEEGVVIETPEPVSEPEEYTEEDMLNEITDTVISEMTLEDKVAGMFIVTPEQLTGVETAVKAGSGTQDALSSYAVGGMVYYPKNIKSTDQIKEMLDTTASMSKYPVFTVMSEKSTESDSVKEIFGLTEVPEITDDETAYEAGSKTGSSYYQYGFNFAVSPFMDITGNGKYGTEVDTVKKITSSFALGLKESGVTSCAYTFPISGNTENGMGSNEISKDDLVVGQYELFKSAIDSGSIGAVMVSNVSLPSVAGDNTPASLSETVISEELRGTLGFNGIVITAPLNEGAVTEYYTSAEAAVNAVKAGADMLYIPDDFMEAYTGLLDAVQKGTISQERIDESLKRIYAIKYADKVSQISN